MSKFNPKKSAFSNGIIAGKSTKAAGKYTNEQLLRRVTLANMLFESNYYQNANTIMSQMEFLAKKVDPETIVNLALECRFEQKLRHTPLWLLLLVQEYHKGFPIKEALSKICTRPDMTMDVLGMIKARNGNIRPIPKGIKKGLAKAFDHYDSYQIAKYKRTNSEISLIDVVNLVHPTPAANNAAAIKELVNDELAPANTWESRLASGEDKYSTFVDMIEQNKLGSLAILRNLRNFQEVGISRKLIKKAISQVNSTSLTPLNFLAAQRHAEAYTNDLNEAMKRCFAGYKISGTTILALDVSGSMGAVTSSHSSFSRMDLAFAMAALAGYIFEDLIIVFTAGSDGLRKGTHMVWNNGKGFSIFNEWQAIYRQLGGGGIFTHQLCEWLKDEGYAADADRLVVISDSQDVDSYYGETKLPDTTP